MTRSASLQMSVCAEIVLKVKGIYVETKHFVFKIHVCNFVFNARAVLI